MKSKETIRAILRTSAMPLILFVLCVAGCFKVPPKIYGLCGVTLGERWDGSFRQFLNASPPEVSKMKDGRVYAIKLELSKANFWDILRLVQKKYNIKPEDDSQKANEVINEVRRKCDHVNRFINSMGYSKNSMGYSNMYSNEFEEFKAISYLFKDPYSSRYIRVWEYQCKLEYRYKQRDSWRLDKVYIEAVDLDLWQIESRNLKRERTRRQNEEDLLKIKGL